MSGNSNIEHKWVSSALCPEINFCGLLVVFETLLEMCGRLAVKILKAVRQTLNNILYLIGRMCNCFMYGVMCIMFGFDDDLLRVITGKLKINLIALFNTNSN